MKKRHILLILIIYLVSLLIRVYWVSQKDCLYIDELYNLNIIFFKEQGFSQKITPGEYSGGGLQETSLVTLHSGIKDTLKDIFKLWKDNHDPDHASLYYMLLRPLLINLKTFDLKEIIYRSAILNLVLFSLSFLFFYWLLTLTVPGSPLLKCLCLAGGFLNPASVSTVLLFREYQLQCMAFILFIYYFIKTYNSTKIIYEKQKKSISGQFILFAFITAITLSSGYYSFIFIFLIGIYVICDKCKTKKYSDIRYYICVFLAGVGLAQLMYLKYMNFLFSRPEALNIAAIIGPKITKNLSAYIEQLYQLPHKYYFTWPVTLLYAACAIYLLWLVKRGKKISIDSKILSVSAASILFYIIVLFLNPYMFLRYILSVFPFFILLFAAMVHNIYATRKTPAILLALLAVACFTMDIMKEQNILYCYKGRQKSYVFLNDPHIPVYIKIRPFEKKTMNMFSYPVFVQMLDKYTQKYIIIENISDIPNSDYSEYYVLMDDLINNYYSHEELSNYDILQKYDITEKTGDEARGKLEHRLSLYKLKKHDDTPHRLIRNELLDISNRLKGK